MPTLSVRAENLAVGDIIEYGGTLQRVDKLTPKGHQRITIQTTLPHSEWVYDEFYVYNEIKLTVHTQK